jgi:hypothetical protein
LAPHLPQRGKKENRVVLATLKNMGAAPDSIGKCHGFVPYKQGHGSEPL